MNQPQPRLSYVALAISRDWNEETSGNDLSEEEPCPADSSQRNETSRMLSCTTSRLKAGLKKSGAYASLINLSDESLAVGDSETSSLCSLAGDTQPFCVYSKVSGQAQIHIQHQDPPDNNVQSVLVVIGGMLEGQVPWKTENLAFWKTTVFK